MDKSVYNTIFVKENNKNIYVIARQKENKLNCMPDDHFLFEYGTLIIRTVHCTPLPSVDTLHEDHMLREMGDF